MKWLEVSLEVDPETAEAVSELFYRFGETAVEIPPDGFPVTVKLYLPYGPLERLKPLNQALWHLGQLRPIPEPQVRELEEKDWVEAWKAHFQPQHIGRRLVVCPSWWRYTPSEDEVVITLDPGAAFGTGLHPTTRMCLEALEERIFPGARVLDLGTGSGILAIAAAKLGAGQVLALDVDPLATEVAQGNVLANGVEGVVEVRAGSLEEAQGSRFNLILVNIRGHTIIALVEAGLPDLLEPKGYIVAGGILASEEEKVVASFQEHGLKVEGGSQREDWKTILATKGG